MTAPISNGPTTTRLHHYAGHYCVPGEFAQASDVCGELFVHTTVSPPQRVASTASILRPQRIPGGGRGLGDSAGVCKIVAICAQCAVGFVGEVKSAGSVFRDAVVGAWYGA